jgi:hypothetical protein
MQHAYSYDIVCCRLMKPRKGNGEASLGASPNIGPRVALAAEAQRLNANFANPEAQEKDQGTVDFTIRYINKYYVSYSIVREREVNRRREFFLVAPPQCACESSPSVSFSSLSLITPTPCYIFPPSSRFIRS